MLAAAGSLAAWPKHGVAQPSAGPAFRPEAFGAVGDGVTDDTLAFQALGRLVSERRGGTVVLRRDATYRLGRQTASEGRGGYAFASQPMLRIERVQGLVIRGNGAILKLNDGLRYGSFDPATGARHDPPAKGKFTSPAFAAVVGRMIEIVGSSDVHITDLTLDGSIDTLVVGGRWGDISIQLAATGLQMTGVRRVLVERVTARNNGLDGVYLAGRNKAEAGGDPDEIVLRDVRCDRNGRQGMSVVGGRGMRFERCTFSNTAQGKVKSRPRAGVDVEPNGRDWATNLRFDDCRFLNNRGVGLLADTGNSRGLVVRNCEFWQGFAPGGVAGSGDALWLGREGVRIEGCRIHGNITNAPSSAQVRTTIFDDAVHPTYGRAAQVRRYLLDNAGGVFTDCSFTVAGGRTALIFAKPAIELRRCRLHVAAPLPKARPVASFSRATLLRDVTFTEAKVVSSAGRRFIVGGGARLEGKVMVTGPGVRWNRPDGPIGVIAS